MESASGAGATHPSNNSSLMQSDSGNGLQTFQNIKMLVKQYCNQVYTENEMIISKLNKKPKLYRLPRLWVWYRYLYPFIFITLFLVFMIIAFTAWNMATGHLVLGSILSLICSLSVLASYIMIIPWRKHPSSLILYRALTSVIFSINIILNAISTDSKNCRSFATVTEFMLLAGEAWLTTIAADLVASITNPFTSYKANVQRYHVMVWSFCFFISFIFYFDQSCQGRFDNAICWVNMYYGGGSCIWGFYLIWMVLMYSYQMYASVYAYLRLKKGLPATFEIRKKCAEETFRILLSYAAYMSVIAILYIIVSASNHNITGGQPQQTAINFNNFVLYVIANKGSVDGFVWFMLHEFDSSNTQKLTSTGGQTPSHLNVHKLDSSDTFNPLIRQYSEDLENESLTATAAAAVDTEASSDPSKTSSSRHHRIKENANKLMEKLHVQDIQKTFTQTVTELADLAIEEVDEGDLSPQVNLALRQQIVQYVTSGVKQSIAIAQSQNSHARTTSSAVTALNTAAATGEQIKQIVDPRKDPAIVEGLQVTEFLLEQDQLPFKSFADNLFQEIRQNEGIENSYYLELLSQPANERLSEGASGAFMFFCGDNELIVKTIRAREAKVLHQSMNQYSDYLRSNHESFLCKFLGSYSLKVYSQTFYFVIMRNCFDPQADINERYDIKGSWVGRSADPSKTKKKATCRHCNTYFIPSRKEQCSVIVGQHEENVVLKDNDLRTKISLNHMESKRILSIIKKDSDLLGRLGVIDYSLLIGVKKWKFQVNVPDADLEKSSKVKKRSNTATSTSTAGVGLDRSVHTGYKQPSYKAYSVSGPAVYYFGIVDFLQDWTFNKKVERQMKIYVFRKDPDGLSVTMPLPYKLRFQRKMEQIFDMHDLDTDDMMSAGLGHSNSSASSNGVASGTVFSKEDQMMSKSSQNASSSSSSFTHPSSAAHANEGVANAGVMTSGTRTGRRSSAIISSSGTTGTAASLNSTAAVTFADVSTSQSRSTAATAGYTPLTQQSTAVGVDENEAIDMGYEEVNL